MERLKYYIANTYINCKGEASVSFYCSEDNINGTYLSGDFNNENIVLFDEEKVAVSCARNCGNSYTAHGTWTK